jgi:hypothetical protein
LTCETNDACLGGAVVGLTEEANLARDRGNVHDRAAVLLITHYVRCSSGAEPSAAQVYRDDLVKHVLGHFSHISMTTFAPSAAKGLAIA